MVHYGRPSSKFVAEVSKTASGIDPEFLAGMRRSGYTYGGAAKLADYDSAYANRPYGKSGETYAGVALGVHFSTKTALVIEWRFPKEGPPLVNNKVGETFIHEMGHTVMERFGGAKRRNQLFQEDLAQIPENLQKTFAQFTAVRPRSLYNPDPASEASAEIWAMFGQRDLNLPYSPIFLACFPRLRGFIEVSYPSARHGYAAPGLQTRKVYGKSPLHRLIDYIDADELAAALGAGLSVDIKNKDGKTVRDIYQQNRDIFVRDTVGQRRKLELILGASRVRRGFPVALPVLARQGQLNL